MNAGFAPDTGRSHEDEIAQRNLWASADSRPDLSVETGITSRIPGMGPPVALLTSSSVSSAQASGGCTSAGSRRRDRSASRQRNGC
jgi:hypothetical protein